MRKKQDKAMKPRIYVDASVTMNQSGKKFDAVAMMRSIRDKISADIEGMTLEQELAWLASQELKDPFLKRLRDRIAKQGRAADGALPRR